MLQTLVSSKYQIVIPKAVRKKISIKPGQKLNVYLIDDKIMLTPKRIWPQDYIKELRGLWKNTNPIDFLEQDRNSWDAK